MFERGREAPPGNERQRTQMSLTNTPGAIWYDPQ
jgi:hypothetical protein